MLFFCRDGIKLDKRWIDEDIMEIGDNFLTLKKLIGSDAGMYQARAKNRYGDVQFSVELLVTQGMTSNLDFPSSILF